MATVNINREEIWSKSDTKSAVINFDCKFHNIPDIIRIREVKKHINVAYRDSAKKKWWT